MRVAYEKGELESLQERLNMLLADASGLSNTLSSILELSRIEADVSEAVLREFDVAALLHEVAEAARILVGSKSVTVMEPAAPGPLVVCSDPGKVRQIMKEIVNNAAKFTDRGRIALIVNREEGLLRLMVTDTGRGMTPEEMHLYLDSGAGESSPAYAADTATGLGLSIVKRLVRSLGGTLSASSRQGEGTIVEVVLPLGRCTSHHASVGQSHHLVQA
jgi:two-component system sensor histidine kinase/response regulator